MWENICLVRISNYNAEFLFQMRFLNCQDGAKKPSHSILDVGVRNALDNSGFDERMFLKRGGIYKWSKASMNLEWWPLQRESVLWPGDGLEKWRIWFDSWKDQDIFLLQNIQIGSGVHPASYAVGMRETFQGSKAAAAPSLPLTYIIHQGYEWGCTSVPTHIHGMCRNNFTFTFRLLRIACNVWGIFYIFVCWDQHSRSTTTYYAILQQISACSFHSLGGTWHGQMFSQ